MFYQVPTNIMPVYRIYRLDDSQRTSFRWAPHTAGVALLKPNLYRENGSIEAASPYDAWHHLQSTDTPLQLGDVLENQDGELRIYKYVGFEEARWVLPEMKTGLESVPAAAGPPQFRAG